MVHPRGLCESHLVGEKEGGMAQVEIVLVQEMLDYLATLLVLAFFKSRRDEEDDSQPVYRVEKATAGTTLQQIMMQVNLSITGSIYL